MSYRPSWMCTDRTPGPRAGININTGCFGGHGIAHNWIYNSVLETADHGPFNS